MEAFLGLKLESVLVHCAVLKVSADFERICQLLIQRISGLVPDVRSEIVPSQKGL